MRRREGRCPLEARVRLPDERALAADPDATLAAMVDPRPTPAPFDYDDEIFRAGINPEVDYDGSILRDEYRDVHPAVADQLMVAKAAPVLDVGAGTGTLGRLLDERAVPWFGIDRSRVRVANGYGPRARADASRLPFREGSFGGAAALYMLYHLEDPLVAIREAARVLRPGGLFVACAPSRYNHPELLPYLPSQSRDTFDSEVAPEMVASVFDDIRVEVWDALLYRLTEPRMVWNYLVARGTDSKTAEETARRVPLPMWVRAKGAVVWGRKAP